MNGYFSSVGINKLDVGVKLLHVVIFCCVPYMEERVGTFIGLHHGPCKLQVSLHEIYNPPNDLNEFYAILFIMGLITPFSYF